jgi:hypothetical protein
LEACPYLGLAEDADTRLTYASTAHRCRAGRMTRTIGLAHQAAFCLTSTYPSCKRFHPVGAVGPGYLIPVPLRREPPRLRNGEIDRATQAGRFAQRVIVVLLIVVVLMAIGLGGPRIAALMMPALTPESPPPPPVQASALAMSPVPTLSPSPIPTASPAPTPTASPTPAPVVYRVKPGDNLATIAAEHGVTVQAIKNANKLKNSIIRVGQKLVIPPPR